MPHHDLLIIGTGSGNSLVTPELEGLDIGIVEQGRFGGTCLNVGCIPTKMYVLPADRVVEAKEARRLGVTFGEPTIDWPAIRDRVFGRIDPIADGGESYRRSQDFVTVHSEHARFVGERRVRLASGVEVTADQVVIAAGSRAHGLTSVPELAEPDPARGLHTSDTIMRIDDLPRSMVVVGGGYVGCEFAHVFSAFGVEVTQLQRSDVLLSHHEEEVAVAYTRAAGRRYDLRTATSVESATHDGHDWVLSVRESHGVAEVRAEVVLLAVGRTPNGDLLDVGAAGVDLDDEGRVVVDDEQRTSAAGVWALGDVSSHHQLKHVANAEARTVAHNLAVTFGRAEGPLRRSDHRFVPHGVFGHPQIAAFGPTRAELERDGTAFVSATQAYGDIAYGWALEDRDHFLTVHAHPLTRRILAAHCIGPQATTVIQPLVQAATFGQDALEVARGQYWIHPALAELVENALLGLDFPPALDQPPVHRIETDS